MGQIIRFFATILSAVSVLGAAGRPEETPDFAARLKQISPFPSAIAAARTNRIPLEGIDSPTDGGMVNPGDSVTALVNLHEKRGHATQWLIYVEAAVADSNDVSALKSTPMTIYTKSGNKFEFASSPVMVEVRTLGPFTAPEDKRKLKAEDKGARSRIDRGFLSLGLDRAASALIRIKQGKAHGTIDFRGTPYDEAEIGEGRKLAQEAQISGEDERALCGACPALLSYCDCA
jgi:hypothetical protein